MNEFLNKDLLLSISRYSYRSGEEPTISAILDGASTSLKGKFKNEPLIEASIRGALWRAYWGLRAYERARPHLERAIQIHRGQLGEQDASTTESKHDLAIVYFAQNRYDEAERLFTEVLRLTLPRDDRRTIIATSSLAALYKKQSRYKEAEQLLVKLLEGGRAPLDGMQPEVLDSMKQLISLYEAWGKPKLAEQWRAKLPETEAVEQ